MTHDIPTAQGLPPGAGIDRIADLAVYSPPLHDGTQNRRLVPAALGAGFEMIHGTLLPAGGASAHFHKDEWQVIILLEGEGMIALGDTPPEHVGPGTVIRIPPGLSHRFDVLGEVAAKVLVIYSPPLGENGFHKA